MASTPDPDANDRPGKRRTWWHPLLTRVLEWVLSDSCEVRDEVYVGRLPLRLDIVLIRRLANALPDTAFRSMPSLSRRLNNFTLIEFKSPIDVLEYGDWNRLLGCAHLFVSQAQKPISAKNMTLLTLAPTMTQKFREELLASGQSSVEEEPGIHRIEGSAYTAFVVETNERAKLGESGLTLFSREILEHPRQIAENMESTEAEMLHYVMQQIEQFRIAMPAFGDQHMTEKMKQTMEELLTGLLKTQPPGQILKYFSMEERLQGITEEERLQGIPAQKRLLGLSAAERARLRKLLDDEGPG